MISLRQRSIVGGIAWALLSFGIGSIAFISVFERRAADRFDEALANRALNVVAALGHSISSPEDLGIFLADPAYQIPFSGKYWQVSGPEGQLVASPSLADAELPIGDHVGPETVFWTRDTAFGSVRGASRSVGFGDDDWRISVAEATSHLEAEASGIRQLLAATLVMLGLLIVVSAITQTTAILSPLGRLRADVMRRRESGGLLESALYPVEVSPLVDDINQLILDNRDRVERSRRQTADLAHALKTPAAILRNELERFAENGTDVSDASSALQRLETQISRSLARIRAVGVQGTLALDTADLGRSVDRLARLFRSLPDTRAKDLELDVATNLRVRVDASDLEEMLGTLIENAFAWCKHRVRLSAASRDGFVRILIEDDGPGIPTDKTELVLRSGQRLDTSKPGTGLGLAIVNDMANTLGGALALSQSDKLGGLRAVLSLPAALANPSAAG